MSIKKLGFMLFSACSIAALLNGCGSSSNGGPSGTAAVLSGGVGYVGAGQASPNGTPYLYGTSSSCMAATCHGNQTSLDVQAVSKSTAKSVASDIATTKTIAGEFSVSLHNPDVSGTNHSPGCQGCHGGGANHNGVGAIPFPNPLNQGGAGAGTQCINCHAPGPYSPHPGDDLTNLFAQAKGYKFAEKCGHCHSSTTKADGTKEVGGVHSIGAGGDIGSKNNCVECHDIAAPYHGDKTTNTLVNDNNGVRAITTEFTKWSHHVTGVTVSAAQCTACHLEGTVSNGAIVVDTSKHMADNKTHLRDADDDSDLAWNPDAPSHSTMDTFCMSCHDANGATSTMSAQIQLVINTQHLNAPGKTASALNPFGDTISNRYDKMQRPAVTNVDSQFNTTNNSHHGVKGKRYTGRTRAAGSRQIASAATFASNSTALLQGARSTIYDAGNFNQLYVPLEDATGETNVEGSLQGRTGSLTLGDDSTLHCGDCHTVGQWKVGSSVDHLGQPTTAAIGAHGSNNEYLLRNYIGTDERHTQNAYTVTNNVVTYTNPNGAFLVCYNCHSYSKYGSFFTATGLNPSSPTGGPHAGEYDQAGRCNGIGNTLPFNGYTTGTATDGTQFASRFNGPINTFSSPAPYAGEQNPDFGNIFGIQCLNCHNSGVGNAYGGIHGSANNTSWNNGTTTITPQSLGTPASGGYYIDGMGNANKVERFLPGLGDAMHVPGTLGGITGGSVVPAGTNGVAYSFTTGGISNDANWEQKHWQQTATTVFNYTTNTITGTLTSAGAGCYTLGSGTTVATNVTAGLSGPSATGQGGAATPLFDTWGGCDDHSAAQGGGNHGFIKRILRPVTY